MPCNSVNLPRSRTPSVAAVNSPSLVKLRSRSIPLVFVAVFGCATLLHGQGGDTRPGPDAWHFRFDLFQMLLEQQGLKIGDRLETAIDQPDRSVLVLVATGETAPPYAGSTWQKLATFVEQGGRLVLASDRSMLVPSFGTFRRGPATTEVSGDQYQGFHDCLLIRPTASGRETLAGVSRLATNRSGWFMPNTYDWSVLAALPDDCLPFDAQGKPLMAMRQSSRGDGFVLALSDPSMLTNGMLWHADNALNAIRISELLSGSDREHLLFLVDEHQQASYREQLQPDVDPNSAEAPTPDSADALQLANAILREVDAANLLNETLREQPRGIRPGTYFRGILNAVALLFVLGTMWVLWRASRSSQFVFPLPHAMRPHYVAEHDGAGSDFRTAAGFLAREFCLDQSGSRHSSDWQQLQRQMKSAVPEDQASLRRVIDIACRGCQQKLTRREFAALGKTIERLRAQFGEPQHAS